MSADPSIEKLLEKVNESIAKIQENGPEKREIECPYEFGYLAKNNKKESVPDECLLCPKLTKCVTTLK